MTWVRAPRVVVTGLGAVSAWGWGVGALHRGLHSGRSAIRPTKLFDTAGHRTRLAAEVAEPPPSSVVDEVRRWRHMARVDRFAVAAALEAWRQARLGPAAGVTGLVFGNITGAMAECEQFYSRLVGRELGHPPLRLLTSQQICGPGEAVARQLGLNGPVQTVSSACASGGLALDLALQALRIGRAEVMLAGGADALCQLTYGGFNALRSVDPEPCRPFAEDRAGLSIGEGAGVLVLETLEHARGRNAVPLAELLGAGASCDAHHMTAPRPDGRCAGAAITAALEDAGITPEDVAFVNSHGTGTPHNDVAESRALHLVFGELARHLPITATKASVGHLLGSAGAIEAVATALDLAAGLVHPVPGDGSTDPQLELDVVRHEPRPIRPGSVGISTSFAFGGANSTLVFRHWSEGDGG